MVLLRRTSFMTSRFGAVVNSAPTRLRYPACHRFIRLDPQLHPSSPESDKAVRAPPPPPHQSQPELHMNTLLQERRDMDSYRRAFDRVVISDSLEGVINQKMTMQLSGAEVLFRLLQSRGIKRVFGYSGGAVLPLIDRFHPSYSAQGQNINGHYDDMLLGNQGSHEKGIQFVNTAHEQTAAHAAQAAGRLTGVPGVTVVTSGPGLTNCITAMQDAKMDGDPMLVISGQVPAGAMGTEAFQEAPATALTKPCTKWNYLVMDVESLPWAFDTAIKSAMTGRKGPVHLDLPKNVLVGEGEVPVAAVFPGAQRDLGQSAARRANAKLAAEVDEDQILTIADLISRAERPVIIAGHGAVDAFAKVRKLAEKCSIPVTTTIHGMGIMDERHRLSLHMLGMHGSAYANFAVQNADLIICLGSRFDDRTTGTLASYAPAAHAAAERGTGGIVQVEVDRKRIGKTVKPDYPVVADCGYVLDLLLSKVEAKKHDTWLAQINEWKLKHPFSWLPAPGNAIKVQETVAALYAASQHPSVLQRRRPVTVCTGVGNHQMMTAQFFRWLAPRQMVTSGGLGTMGSGLPFAIGAQATFPDNLVLLIDGDGSFNMSSSELATVAAFGLPIKIAIMNDGLQQMVRAWQHLFFEGRYFVTHNANPDYVKLAKSFGIPAVRCSSSDTLNQVALDLLTSDGPMLVDFRVVPDFCVPMVKPGCALDDMILSSSQIPDPKSASATFDRNDAPA